MISNWGNRDGRFVWRGSIASVNDETPGDGITPSYPIASFGGLIPFVINVDVPATAAGALADWATTYPPPLYTSPENSFDLIRYVEPLDTTKKLAGRGNLWLKKAVVFQGTNLTGAVQPTQGGGTIDMAIRTAGSLTNLWQYSAAIPTGTQIVTPASELAKGVIIGTDVGDDAIVFVVQPVTNNLVAGRYRILLLGCEV